MVCIWWFVLTMLIIGCVALTIVTWKGLLFVFTSIREHKNYGCIRLKNHSKNKSGSSQNVTNFPFKLLNSDQPTLPYRDVNVSGVKCIRFFLRQPQLRAACEEWAELPFPAFNHFCFLGRFVADADDAILCRSRAEHTAITRDDLSLQRQTPAITDNTLGRRLNRCSPSG